MNELTAQ